MHGFVGALESHNSINSELEAIFDSVSGTKSIVPVIANLWTPCQVCTLAMINTKCQVEGVEGRTTNGWSGVPPLEASSNSGAIIDRFDQVVIDTDGLTHVRVKVVALHDVLNIAGNVVGSNNRVHVASLGFGEGSTTVASLVQAATNSCVSYVQAVSQTQRNTTKECVAIVLESAVITLNVSTVKCYVIAVGS